MAAPSELYVNPALNANSGLGTLASPYGDLEYAIRQTLFDTTNGHRVNIQQGAEEILVADLSVAMADVSVNAAWVPTGDAPMFLQGYQYYAGDGGIATISGGGSVGILLDVVQSDVHFRDLHLRSTGANRLLWIDNYCTLINVEFSEAGDLAILGGNYTHIEQCYFHDITNSTGIINTSTIGLIRNCRIDTCNVGAGYYISNSGTVVDRCVLVMEHVDSDAIRILNSGAVTNCSIYHPNSGVGYGIYTADLTSVPNISGNLIEGFSGVNGKGVYAAHDTVMMLQANAVFDCTDPYALSIGTRSIDYDNEILTESPFVDAANGDFTPKDIGNLKEGSLPNRWYV